MKTTDPMEHVKVYLNSDTPKSTWSDFSLDEEVFKGVTLVDSKGNVLRFEGEYTMTKNEQGGLDIKSC